MKKEQKQTSARRIIAFEVLITLFIALICARLFIVSVVRHEQYQAQAENQHTSSKHITAKRGDILITDKTGQQQYLVATNTFKDMVYARPPEIKNVQSTADTLAGILSLDPKDVLAKIIDPQKKYVVIAHGLTDDQSKTVMQANIAGIYLDPEGTRVYPENEFLSQVLGFVGYNSAGTQKVGLYGLEKYMQKDLAGVDGSITTQTDHSGNWVAGSQVDGTPAIDGSSLLLTIDRAIQYKVESVLRSAVQMHGADSGTAIVMNPKTGAILAMANEASFDPNQYNKVADHALFTNSATLENYEPGSTMKALTMAAGLDLNVITPQTTYTDTGSVKIAGYTIKNAEGNANGLQTMTDVLDKSLNTGAIFVEQQIGNDKFKSYLKAFGLGVATDIELQENIGDIKTLDQPSQINFYTASFGQGVTTTPIQMVQSYSALANGGKMVQPYIIDSKILPDNSIQKTQPKVVRQVISPRAASLVTAMLVDDVENGFGKKAGVKGYYLGGKTGTAQVVQNGKYVENDNIGSFIGYGPIENPQFLILVNINHPRDVKFAESTAAPAFHDIAAFILNYYQIPPSRN